MGAIESGVWIDIGNTQQMIVMNREVVIEIYISDTYLLKDYRMHSLQGWRGK